MTALLVPRYASDITSQWLTATLRERGLLGDGAVHRVYANDIGIGRGFVGRTLRLEIEYDQVVSGAPASLVAKLPSAIEQQDAGYAQLIAALYGNEIRWYRELAHDCPLRVPRAFWEGIDQADGRYCLLLEDVGHLAMFDQSTSCDDDTARCVVRAAADLHARWWTDPALVARNWLPGPEAHAAVLGGLFEQGWDRFWARLGSRLDPAFEEVGIRLRSELGRIVSELPAEHTTLIHSDYRIENFMFGTTGTPDELVVLDWQTVSLGSGPRDVAYFVGQSLTVEARRRLEWELLRLYHDRLLQNGVAGYVWEQCVQDYKRGLLIATQLPVNGAFRLEAIVPPANPQHRPYYDQAIATGEAMVLMLAQRAVAAVLDNDAVSVMD